MTTTSVVKNARFSRSRVAGGLSAHRWEWMRIHAARAPHPTRLLARFVQTSRNRPLRRFRPKTRAPIIAAADHVITARPAVQQPILRPIQCGPIRLSARERSANFDPFGSTYITALDGAGKMRAAHSFPMFHRKRRQIPNWLCRLTAVVNVALVLTLAVFAASPKLHAKLHGGPQGHEDSCPVAVFANGVSTPLGSVVTLPAIAERQVPTAVTAENIFLASPRYLRQPERGPPTLG